MSGATRRGVDERLAERGAQKRADLVAPEEQRPQPLPGVVD